MFMRLPTLLACLTVSASLYAVACRSDDNNTPSDGQGSNGSGNFVKIQQVQDDAMAPGTAVNLHDVVVTAIDNYGTKVGDIWVEEKEGGKRSGLHVFKAQTSDVAMLAIGDEIDLKGAIKSEFALTGSNADSTGRTETELEPASGGQITIAKLGMSTTITPDKVDALAIGKMYDPSMSATGGGTAFSSAWEDWEGVLIELDNVDALNASACVGTACSDPTLKKFSITGIATAESSLAAFADDANIKRGYCFGSITGVVSYFYDYLIYPRSAADMTGNGTSCPAAEQATGTDGTVCTDGTDNDGNGFADCADLGCEAGSNAWLGADGCQAADTTCGCSKNYASGASVQSVNTMQATASSAVYLRDVYVTAVNGTFSYWVADSTTAAVNGGILVFSKPPTGAVVGQKISTLQGIGGPFGSGTLKVIELSNATASAPSGTNSLTPIMGVATDMLTDATNGAQYTGSLVTLTKAKVTVAENSFGQIELTDTAGKKIKIDDDAWHFYGGTGTTTGTNGAAPALNACLTVTGIMDVQTTDQIRTINPRSAADLVTATGCP
jgi:hypothetical protein